MHPSPFRTGKRRYTEIKVDIRTIHLNAMSSLNLITFILLVVGGLNWLLYALTGMDVGSILGGMDSMIAKVIYILVGLSALYQLFTHKWSSGSPMM